MKLFILRHGMTAEADTDARRELSDEGVIEVEKIVQLKRDALRDVTRMYSSPMQRVQQTLAIASRILDFDGPIIESQYLTTGSRLKEIVSFMNEMDFGSGDVIVSSHQSCTSILVLWLTGEDVLISNGSLLAIDVAESRQGAGRILWQESHNSSDVKRAVNFVDQF